MTIEHLLDVYPELSRQFSKLDIVSIPQRTEWCVEKAVLKVICGQMLSRAAATTIFNRLMVVSNDDPFICMTLSDEKLKGCGLSNQKLKTVRNVYFYSQQRNGLEFWRNLTYQELKREVTSVWGLSQWSTDILAIFYFGHTDVYPIGDGTLKKVAEILSEKYFIETEFNPQKARPYRTFLSLAMWKMYDGGLF